MEKFEIKEGKFGKKMVPKAEWSKEMESYFRANDIKELDLNIAFGWQGKNLEFLKALDSLQSLEILDGVRDDVSPIHFLSKLKRLKLELVHKTVVDYSCFPKLEDLVITWSPGNKSFSKCISLKNICIFRYNADSKNLCSFSKLINLEQLCLKGTNIREIGDLSGLRGFRKLEIGLATKLSSLGGLEKLSELIVLGIQGCRKLSNINGVTHLNKLEVLNISGNGDIKSLKPIEGLKNLQKVFFYDDTNILDGDLTVLKCLPRLKDVSFKQRRHYNLKRIDLPGYKKINRNELKAMITKQILSAENQQ